MSNESYSEEGINGSLINLQGYISPDNNDFKLTNKGISSWSFDGSIPVAMRYVEIWNKDLGQFNVKPGNYILITDDVNNPQARPIIRVSTDEDKRFFNKTENSSVDFSDYLPSIEITDVFGDGEFVTYTADNDLVAGDRVTIANVLPSIYNFVNVAVVSATTTSFTVSGTGTASYVSGGTAEIISSFTSEVYVDYLDENFIEQRKVFLPIVGQDGYPLETIYLVYEKWEDRSLGTDGWTISSSGNAIFNNLAIRGEINATSGNFDGFVTVNDGSMKIGTDVSSLEEANVTQFEIDTNKVILTTETNHGFIVDDIIVVEGIDSINAMFPDFPESNLVITNAVGDGEEVTYTCVNSLIPGSEINITGVSPASYNASQVSVFSATATEIVIKSTVTDTYASGGEIEVTGIPSNPQDINGKYVVSAVTSNTLSYDFVGNDFGPALVSSGLVKGELTNSGMYIDDTNYWYDDGRFSLGTDTKNISFDGTNVTISSDVIIEGGLVAESLTLDEYNYWTPTLTGAEFRAGSATAGIIWDESTFEIKGDLVTGTIGASAGGINGWNISEGIFASGETTTYVALSASPSNAYSIWAGGETASTAPFSVKRDGTLKATSATITGDITATSGTFTGAVNASSGTFTGYVSAGTSRFGVAVQTGKDGIWLDANNYAYSDGTFSFGGVDGITYSGTGSIQIGTDVEITGGVTATSFAIDAENYWNTPGNEGVFSSNSGKLGNWTLNDEEIFSDISDTGNTYRTGIKAATGVGGGTYTPSIFYMVHDHDTEGAIPSFNSANTPFYADSNGRFSLADKLYFDQDIHGSGDNAQLVVIGKIRGQIENTELALDAIPNANAKTITQIQITATDTAVITAATHGFAVDDTVIISDLTTTTLNGAWKVFSVTTNTFTIKSDGLTVGSAYADSGLARIRELTLGLHPAVGASPAGLGIRLDEYNYWFVNNKFRIGGSANYVDWSGSQLTVKGTINDLELGRGGGNIASNFAVGIGALSNNISGGTDNIALGQDSLKNNTTGSFNLGVGYRSLYNNTTGSNNISVGTEALYSSITGSSLIAIGAKALYSNTTGANNTAIGFNALKDNTIGLNNLAIGSEALSSNTTGQRNVAIGYQSLLKNTTGRNNIAIGAFAMVSNTTGFSNTAIGFEALMSNTSGMQNVAIGTSALRNSISGDYNVAIGNGSLAYNELGSNNVAIGVESGGSGSNNVAVGYQSMSNSNTQNSIGIGRNTLGYATGLSNVAIGSNALRDTVSGDANIAIGSSALYQNVGGQFNIAMGSTSLGSNISGSFNLAMGADALAMNTASNNYAIGYSALRSNTTGTQNIAIGYSSLVSNQTGSFNTAIGYYSLHQNKSGFNTAIGYYAAKGNTTGTRNFAIGYNSLLFNSIGTDNMAIGHESLRSNTASNNLAIGNSSLYSNTLGSNNLAIGIESLKQNTTGTNNIALGQNSLLNNTTGSYNIAVGYNSLKTNTKPSSLIAIGAFALENNNGDPDNSESPGGINNLAIGGNALRQNTSGRSNIAIGYDSLSSNTTGFGNTAIGYLSLSKNTTGVANLAIGTESLSSVITGSFNIAIGNEALRENKGNYNVAIGDNALVFNTTGEGNFAIGTTALSSNTYGSVNMAMGQLSLLANTTGSYNLAIGSESMRSNTYGEFNIALGDRSLFNNITGSSNVAIGKGSLFANKASNNIAIGSSSLYSNTVGEINLAIGLDSLASNTTGSYNLGIGNGTLKGNVSGILNTAIGYKALVVNKASNNFAIGAYSLNTNSSGTYNFALGNNSMLMNSIGSNNVAIGEDALSRNIDGNYNLAIGYQSMYSNTDASNNVAIGWKSLYANTQGIQNIAIGQLALTSNSTGQNSIAIGYAALSDNTVGVDNIAIGIGALTSNTTGGEYNMAIGNYALMSNRSGTQNIAIGGGALSGTTTASGNIAVGLGAGASVTSGQNNLFLGGFDGTGFETASNRIHISDGAGNVRIRSDSGGRVTMPNTPAFSVYSSFVSTQSGNLTYNATNSNNGGHMNLGTGLFTAPVSGYYHFNYYGFIDTGLGGNTTITFQKNGAGFPSRAYNDFNDASYGPVITISAVIYLATNDNVRVNITGAGVHGNDSSFFSGFLIG